MWHFHPIADPRSNFGSLRRLLEHLADRVPQKHRERTRRRRPSRGLRGEALESRQLLAADFFHNHVEPADVNDDGVVSAVDALAVINAMSRPRGGDNHLFTDVNGDGVQSAVDALMVVKRLNLGRPFPGGRDEPSESAIPDVSAEYRAFDGTGNHLESPLLGTAGQNLLRIAESDYADGISAPAGEDRPSPREISNLLSAIDEEGMRNDRNLTAFIYVWGQFLDHDIDLSEKPGDEAAQEDFNISVPIDDAIFNPLGSDDVVIPLTRSDFDSDTGTSPENPREQFNAITSYIDGSQVYGSDQATADSLRAFVGGRLLMRDNGLLPVDEQGNVYAGDIRVAENISLTSMHALFVREHNRLADAIAAENPELTDEDLYQRARGIVIAEIQSITFNEFLPALLGRGAISQYEGYNAAVNPTIANEFSTAAFRFGHSTLNDDIEFFGNDGLEVEEQVALADAFFRAELLEETGIDSVLKYNASSLAQEIDLQVVDGLRNFLFGPPGAGGLDLVALNIQRGRDHGLADYNATRVAYGLNAYESLAELTSDVQLQEKLAAIYGDVNNIDLWVGLLAEDHTAGASVGELSATIIADQFERLRDGDRFFYENILRGADLRTIQQTSLAEIIQRNTDVDGLQDNVFFFRAELSGSVRSTTESTAQAGRHSRRSSEGIADLTVELLDDQGNVIDTTTTDRRGNYRLRNFDETGNYQVRLADTGDTLDVLISTGDQRLQGLDFRVDIG